MTKQKLDQLELIFSHGGILNQQDFGILLFVAHEYVRLVDENKKLTRALNHYASLERGSIARRALDGDE